jgi:hypothetical protein
MSDESTPIYHYSKPIKVISPRSLNFLPTQVTVMDNGSNNKIIEEICSYSEKIDAKDMLHEYMKRSVFSSPELIVRRKQDQCYD